MEDSYIITNFHTLCRLCLNKSALMVPVFEETWDEEDKINLPSKIAYCSDLQMEQNDGMPTRMCYKCFYKVNKFSKFKLQCIQSDDRLKQIIRNISKGNYNTLSQANAQDHQTGEDSVVMVVDPNLDYDSSGESDNGESACNDVMTTTQNPDREPMQESFYRNVAMCQYCDKAFVTDDECKQHEHSCHDPKLPYNCMECSLVFAERTQYIQHSKHVHGNDKPYQCSECEKSFGRRSDLRKHAIVHTGIRPYQCNYCMKTFSRNTNLSKHLRIHGGQKPHVCPFCPRSFVAKGDLQRHVLVHSGKKPFDCNKCPLSFTRRDKLIKHELSRHALTSTLNILPENKNETNMVINVNPFSNYSSSTDLNLDLPRVPDHISGESSFIGTQTQKTVGTIKSETMPSPAKPKSISNRNKPKNIKCHQCPKRFSSLDAYKTHVSIAHIGLRGFQCKICFKKFSRKRDLDSHIPLHSGMKPFSCGHCDKTFTRKDKLVKHENTHQSLVADMPCIECGDVFQEKADLVAHIKSHFSEDFEEKCRGGAVNDIKSFDSNDALYNLES